jgi:hypothetical protein
MMMIQAKLDMALVDIRTLSCDGEIRGWPAELTADHTDHADSIFRS